ncbi:hypothetical protein D3C77_694080 [compost metagenome]
MRRGSDHVGIRQRVWIEARSNQAGNVRHVDKKIGPDLVSDLTKTWEVEGFRVG